MIEAISAFCAAYTEYQKKLDPNGRLYLEQDDDTGAWRVMATCTAQDGSVMEPLALYTAQKDDIAGLYQVIYDNGFVDENGNVLGFDSLPNSEPDAATEENAVEKRQEDSAE